MAEPSVDVLIITALREELDAVLNAGGVSRSSWTEHSDAEPFIYFKRQVASSESRVVRLAVARALDMGEVSATACAMRLIHVLKPRALAMCGVCAGRKGEVELGDVIVAERLFKFDSGSAVSSNDGANYEVQLFGDIRTYSLPTYWRYAAEEFGEEWHALLLNRPLSIEEHEAWFLKAMHTAGADADPAALVPPNPDAWPVLLERLRAKALLDKTGRKLTPEGQIQASFEALRSLHGGRRGRPKAHLGAIGTSARVQRDSKLFERLAVVLRKTLGAEMEGSALGAVAELEGLDMIMVKGVMDFGTPEKNDGYKAYAAAAAAEYLVAFLAENQLPAKEGTSPDPSATPPPPLAPSPPPAPGGAPLAPVGAPPPPGGPQPGPAAAALIRPPSPPITSTEFAWFLVVDGGLEAASVASVLGAQYPAVTVVSQGEGVFKVQSSQRFFEVILGEVRAGTARIGRNRIEYVCRAEGTDPNDTHEGLFGRLPRRNGCALSAEFVGEDDGWYSVALSVRSTEPTRPLEGKVTFYLHESFDEDVIAVKVRSGRARLPIVAFGSFTVGAKVEARADLKLELDLGNVANVPRSFIDEGRRRKRAR